MGYYDNVKNNIRDESTDSNENKSSSSGNFDTLKKAASETDPEEEGGDDTPIEVLEEDGLDKKRQKKTQNTKTRQEKSEENKSTNPFNNSSNESEADTSGIEKKLDTIIDQNKELINILRGFAD